jgi:uncharacterized protein
MMTTLNFPTPSSALQFRSITYTGVKPGPKLIVLGAVHGNEVCGSRGILKVLSEIDSQALRINAGTVTFVPITNPLAFQKMQRNGDRNLNRNLTPTNQPQDFEDQIANWLCPLLVQHQVLLDLHSFHTGGEPFAMLGPVNNTGTLEPFSHAVAEEALALRLGVKRFVDGWLDTYARGVSRRVAQQKAVASATNASASSRAHLLNTDPRYGIGTTEYMRSVGGYSITLECGQHHAENAPLVAYNAIHNSLAHLGIVDAPKPPVATQTEALSLYEVIDKADANDAFSRAWASFDPISKGDLIGTRVNGEQLLAQENGYIVFPNPKAEAGQEWFYLAKRNQRV